MSGGPIQGGGFTFRLMGFPVRLHPSVLLIVGLVVLMQIRGGPSAALWGAIMGVVILASVLIHELGHALAGRALGMGPIDITLHGFGGYTRSTRRRGPRAALLMTAAGPAAGLLLGALAMGLYLYGLGDSSPTAYWLLRKTAEVNLFWSLFNLLPLIPMDGGLILLQALTMGIGERRAETLARGISVFTGVLTAAVAFYFEQNILAFFAIYLLSRNVGANRLTGLR